uniref:Hexosyltransferase n=1 Tax=Oryza barthii TaxID=65489 RepID=A0A0D3HU64_9ORYZ
MSYLQPLRTSLQIHPHLLHVAPLSCTSLPSAAQIAPPNRADSALFLSLDAHRSRLAGSGVQAAPMHPVNEPCLAASASVSGPSARGRRLSGMVSGLDHGLLNSSRAGPLQRSPTAEVEAAAKCPQSVMRSADEFHGRGRVVELPCGLTLGSHITVVATPRPVHAEGDPQIAVLREGEQPIMVSQVMMELQRRKTVDSEDPLRVLHFNPCLRGDWSGRPLIEHNTCYRMQWGTPLRCEGWKSHSDEETGWGPLQFHFDYVSSEVNVQLKKEAEFFWDIVFVPFLDNYDLVVLKTLAICEYGVHAVSARYVVKCGDDTFVRLDSIITEVNKEWPEVYPQYANGPGYVISSDIAGAIVSEFRDQKLSVLSYRVAFCKKISVTLRTNCPFISTYAVWACPPVFP